MESGVWLMFVRANQTSTTSQLRPPVDVPHPADRPLPTNPELVLGENGARLQAPAAARGGDLRWLPPASRVFATYGTPKPSGPQACIDRREVARALRDP